MSEDINEQFHHVCKTADGTLEKAKSLYQQGANPNFKGFKGVTPLMEALEVNNTDIVQWLLSDKLVDVDIANDNGNTALHYAVRFNKKDAILIAELANYMKNESVNLVNNSGKTALIQAVEFNNVRAVEGLLSVKSVDWEIKDKKNRTLLDLARL